MVDRIIVHTNIVVDNLSEEEKKALGILKEVFGWFHTGFRDNYLAIAFESLKVSEVEDDKSKILWKKTPLEALKEANKRNK